MSRNTRTTRVAVCDAGVDPGDPALPLAGTKHSRIRKSKRARWRAFSLFSVHLLILAHITHHIARGRTISPVEPSEAMYTFELGQVNAGFVFLLLALLSTAIFGRFFCGWGCHIVALQDACGWLMKKIGIRPRPFRSRLLLWVPLAVAFYMFAWPTLWRITRPFVTGEVRSPFPGFSDHLMTASFWKTFPGPVFGVLTLLACGFLAVYLLGAKGFCTYGCPYGGLFGVVDRLSPGRIVVSDACEQCGHCSATCTSNVLVHEEVRLYGQVVDPGCMKCMDCVSVCPKGALSFGFARPAVLLRSDVARPSRYPLSKASELLLAGMCLVTVLAFRGLYDGPPLLLSVGLGGMTAFCAWKLWQLASERSVRLQGRLLKADGRLRPGGRVFVGAVAIWLLFTGHSGFVQWHRAWGRHHLERTEAARADVLSGAFTGQTYSERHRSEVRSAARHFSLADRFGLVRVVEVKLGLAWTDLLLGDEAAAIANVHGALTLAPGQASAHDSLVELLVARGRLEQATVALENKIATLGGTAEDHFVLAGLLIERDRGAEALEHFAAAVEIAPTNAAARYNHGGLLRRFGRTEEAIAELLVAQRLAPLDPDPEVELGLAYQAQGDLASSLLHLRRALELAPDRAESRLYLSEQIRSLERADRERKAPPP